MPEIIRTRVSVCAEDPCHLAFGTSTGAMGLRKFPNPRFNADAWRKVNGGTLGTWDGFARRMADDANCPTTRQRNSVTVRFDPVPGGHGLRRLSHRL